MKTYSTAEARRSLDRVIQEARRSGVVRIEAQDGGTFLLRPAPKTAIVSPLDVPGIELGLGRGESARIVRQMRRRAVVRQRT